MSHINEDTVGNILLKKRVGWQKKVNCLTSLKQFVTYVTYIMSQISKTTNMFNPILLHLRLLLVIIVIFCCFTLQYKYFLIMQILFRRPIKIEDTKWVQYNVCFHYWAEAF